MRRLNSKLRPAQSAFGALAICGALLSGGCASTGVDTGTEPLRAACNLRESCFNQRNVRSYQPLDDQTLLVFVGASRCPFVVTLEGFFCQLRSSAGIFFQDFDGRICNLDRTLISTDPFGRTDDDCRVRAVEPLNDDELIETLAEYGVLEPPPVTPASELEVVEEDPPPAEPAAEEGATTLSE